MLCGDECGSRRRLALFFLGEMPPTPHPVFLLFLQDQTLRFHKPATLLHHTDTSLFQLIPDLTTPTGYITLPHWIVEICNINGAEEMHPACDHIMGQEIDILEPYNSWIWLICFASFSFKIQKNTDYWEIFIFG